MPRCRAQTELNFTLESNSLSLISCLIDCYKPPWDVHPLISECKALLGQYQNIRVVHCLREANEVVDCIVKAHLIKALPCIGSLLLLRYCGMSKVLRLICRVIQFYFKGLKVTFSGKSSFKTNLFTCI